MIYDGPWFDGKARYIIVLVNRLQHDKQDFYFLGYYNYPEEKEVQRLKFVEEPLTVDYYTGFD